MQLTKTVFGAYLLDDGDIADSTSFSADNAVDRVQEQQPLEAEHPAADRVVLPADEIAALADVETDTVYDRQRAVALQYTRQRLSAAGSRDKVLVQAVRALDDINEQNNERSERLRPWYALHFPEAVDAVDSNEELAELVAETPAAEDVAVELDVDDRTGMPFTQDDLAMVQQLAQHLVDGYELRAALEEYIERLAGRIAPNLSAVTGELLAGRLIALAGSLEQLARMPSSTVQVLGAEKAMFRHMEGEGEAPKYGVLFQHEHVQNAPQDRRGEMARVIANKAVIAARIDNYDGEYRGDALRAEIDDRFDSL